MSLEMDSVPIASRQNGRTNAVREASWLPALRSCRLVNAIVLAIAYYLGVHVGFALTPDSSPVSTMWPPNAILLAGLLLAPPRSWWLMIVAVLPAHLAAELALGVPFGLASLWFLSNAGEALIGAALIVRYLGGRPRFDRVRDLSIFIIAGAVVAPLLTSFLDAGFVAIAGWRYDGYWEIWRTRLFSNALATLTLVPLIMVVFQRQIGSLWRPGLAWGLETAALLVSICVASLVVFEHVYAREFATFLYLPLPFLMWAALRYGVVGVSLCAAIVAGFAITGLLEGPGASATQSAEGAARSVQVFLLIAESSLMLLAASLAELRHSRRTAARQEERLKLALNAAGMGTWEWDIGEDRVTWRPARQEGGSESITRTRSSKQLLRFVHEGDRSAVVQAIEDALRKDGSADVEYRFLQGIGRYSWIASKGRTLTDSEGNPMRMIGVFVDVTERKVEEMRTRTQREQLAHLSRVSILGELSGAIAHELNQPLTSILLNAQSALREMDGEVLSVQEITEILQEIIADDKRAGEVIRRLRALLLRGAVEMRPLDINECIEEVLRLEQNDLTAHQVVTEIQLEKPSPAVIGDRVQLQQVLLNLVVNARDAMASNGTEDRTLRIMSANGDDLVWVRITDSGPGIRDTEAIFEPFFSTKGHGIGMGLAICRTIVSAHGGRVWATNNPARGATFHLCVPTAAAAAAAADG